VLRATVIQGSRQIRYKTFSRAGWRRPARLVEGRAQVRRQRRRLGLAPEDAAQQAIDIQVVLRRTGG
jgi:hypothetical protein